MTQAPANNPRLDRVLAGLDRLRGWQEEFYRDLHRNPELSHQEHRTAAKVVERLRPAGYDIHEGIGATGVVAILRNGVGPTVLLRADMDALPVRERTGLPYASEVTAQEPAGNEVPVMHACGHDVHVSCLTGAARLLSDRRDAWTGTLVVLFQPAEETGDGARAMVEDNLAQLIPTPDVALAQHVLPFPAGHVRTRSDPTLSAADSMRITLHGQGAHGSMPQAAVDPVVLAASIVLRLQTIVSRELAPGEPAEITVGSVQAGTKSNVIPDTATLLLNIRTYSEPTRSAILDAIHRIVVAECRASRCPLDPDFEQYESFPLTTNHPATTARLADAFAARFGDRAGELPRQSASEDFSDIPAALGVPYAYWGIGGIDPKTYGAAEQAGRVNQDIPVNHSATFAPVIQPTLNTGTEALVTAAIAWLSRTFGNGGQSATPGHTQKRDLDVTCVGSSLLERNRRPMRRGPTCREGQHKPGRMGRVAVRPVAQPLRRGTTPSGRRPECVRSCGPSRRRTFNTSSACFEAEVSGTRRTRIPGTCAGSARRCAPERPPCFWSGLATGGQDGETAGAEMLSR